MSTPIGRHQPTRPDNTSAVNVSRCVPGADTNGRHGSLFVTAFTGVATTGLHSAAVKSYVESKYKFVFIRQSAHTY